MRFFKPILSQKTLYAVLAGLASTLIFSSPLFALDPKKRLTQYDMRLYQAEHGLPMNDMKTVFQDSKGYIWLGCQEGLVRFDGARFVLFDKSKYPELRENFIWDIKEDWEGNLWLATNGGGVSRFDGKTFTTFDTSNGLASNVIRCILIAKDQKIWFGTEKGISLYKDGTFKTLILNGNIENQQIYCFLEDDSGHLVVGRRHYGLEVLIDGNFWNFPIDSDFVRSVFKRRSGEILIGTALGRIYAYRDGRIHKFNPYQLPTIPIIQAMLEDQEGNMWFCTDGNGVVRYANGRFETLKAENGLPKGHNFFLRGIEDREGNLWFVGDGGLLQLKDNKFTAFG